MSDSLEDSDSNKQKEVSKDAWKSKLQSVDVSRAKLNQIIMNFLVVEGHKDVAMQFASESGTAPDISLDLIGVRMVIKKCIHEGKIEEAIERINYLNPLILGSNPTLFFHLECQAVIELIRQDKTEEALKFCQDGLAELTGCNAAFLPKLEQVMTLVAFGRNGCSELPCAILLTQQHRSTVATEVNEAILQSQGQSADSRLALLLKRLAWEQNQLADVVKFPVILDFQTAVIPP